MFTPVVFNRDELFRFGGAVGPLAPNSTDDVAKVEIALDGLGFFTVNRRRGPSGEFHAGLDQGLRAFQRARGLKEDATVKPDGPTIRKLAQETAEASGPDEIDDSAPPSDSGGIKDIK
ncbi:MAG: peptidoglycan-binding protein, partial [Rhodospirillales bacterium]